MPRKKKEFNLKARITGVLRDLSRQWPAKKEARLRAKVKVIVGTYKNGNPKYGTKYQCAECRGLFDQKETHMDHIESVTPFDIDAISLDIAGYLNNNPKLVELMNIRDNNVDIALLARLLIVIPRMFSFTENYQCLCKACHGQKTKEENVERKKNKPSLDF